MGFGLAVRDGATAEHGAPIDVPQTLPSNAFAPASARFLTSTPLLDALSKDIWTGGFPRTRFPRKKLPFTPGARKIPLVFPRIVFSSTMFPVSIAAGRPTPKFEP
jgi:hypothetical protein